MASARPDSNLSGVRAGGRSNGSAPSELPGPERLDGRGDKVGFIFISLGLLIPEGVVFAPLSAVAKFFANSEPINAASNNQGPNRWRMEEHLGLVRAGSIAWCSGIVPVTAFKT